MGSWWAYYELGWGGWWFWDPVENASFMPWLAATALVHSLAVTDKRGAFKSWTLCWRLLGFRCLYRRLHSTVWGSNLGALLRGRSRAWLIYFAISAVGGWWFADLVRVRAGRGFIHVSYGLLSREFFMLINNVILVVSLAVVLWGTLAP